MAKKSSLREFQAHLAARLAGTSDQNTANLLGIQSGKDYWLINLSDSGEIVSLPALAPTPLTKPWFAGIANIRGNLYAVTDFSAFRGKEATPKNQQAQLLLVGARYGSNAALLVTRLLGLRNLQNLTRIKHSVDSNTDIKADSMQPLWAGGLYVDENERHWQMLDIPALLVDEHFMNISV